MQEMNVAEEEINRPESVSGPSQELTVPLLFMQFLYVGSVFESRLCFLLHSLKEEFEEPNDRIINFSSSSQLYGIW